MTQLNFPLARRTDPHTSRLAADSIRPANNELVSAIRRIVGRHGPCSHDDIAWHVGCLFPERWRAASIVTACARAGLVQCGVTENERGRTVATWETAGPIEDIEPVGEML